NRVHGVRAPRLNVIRKSASVPEQGRSSEVERPARGNVSLHIIEEDAMAFTLPPLPYPADALEPSIDKMTMEIHHGRHHKAYVDNLNAALEGQSALASKNIVQLLREINQVPEAIRQKVINNGGGHANHTMFWEIMGPKAGGAPTGPVAEAIKSAFSDFASFKAKLKEAGMGRFGSGWAWLVLAGGKPTIISMAN